MDDTPKAFLEEIRTSIMRRRVGQIALAVVIAEAIWHLISALTWSLVIPVLARFLDGDTESVLFRATSKRPIPWDMLAGSLMEFLFTLIVVFYLNRWIHHRPKPVMQNGPQVKFNMVGQPANSLPMGGADEDSRTTPV